MADAEPAVDAAYAGLKGTLLISTVKELFKKAYF